MMNTREKMIELLRGVQYQGNAVHGYHDKYIQNSELADHLIANGVTVQKWIPVSEMLPDNIGMYLVIEKHWISGSPCRRIAKWNTVDWCTADRRSKELTPRITHWMPLPEPPKDDQHKHFPTGDCK